MKCVYIFINKLSDGGAERVASILANELVANNRSVYLVTFEDYDKEYVLDQKINRIRFRNNGSGYKKLISDFSMMKHKIEFTKMNVYIAIDIYAYILLGLMKYIKRFNLISTERNSPKDVNISLITKFLRFITFKKADYFIFQTKSAMDFYGKKIKKRAAIIQNPLLEGLPFKNDEESKVIFAMGRLVEQKNYKMMLDAFNIVVQKYPDYHLYIYGDGVLRLNLEDYVIEKNISNVKFNGFSTNIFQQVLNHQIFILTSDYEGLPNSLIEAMAMGYPVISTDCPAGGPASVIISGENGLLSDVKDYVKFSEKIIYLINNPAERKRLGDNAKKIKELLSAKVIIDKWIEIIDKF